MMYGGRLSKVPLLACCVIVSKLAVEVGLEGRVSDILIYCVVWTLIVVLRFTITCRYDLHRCIAFRAYRDVVDLSEDGPNYIIPALHREMHYIKNAKFQVIARQHSISYRLAHHGLNH